MRARAGISRSKLKKIFDKLDKDGSGELDIEEFSQYKFALDREVTVGHIIAKELSSHAPELLQQMRQVGSPDKMERAASLTHEKRRKSAGGKDDLTSLFEMTATPEAKKPKAADSPARSPSKALSTYERFHKSSCRSGRVSHAAMSRACVA